MNLKYGCDKTHKLEGQEGEVSDDELDKVAGNG